MSAERHVQVPVEVSGIHRLEVVSEEAAKEREVRDRPTLRAIEQSGRTPPAPGLTDFIPTDLGSPELYLNRELTYLNFCWRVLQEAADDRVPLLERLKFIAIVSSNIDEFFQKRIGGLKQQVGAQVHSITADGRTPQQQLVDCLELMNALEKKKVIVLENVIADLRAVGVWLAPYKELDAKEQAWAREFYLRNIFPLVTPQAMDPAHPFPFVSNLSLNLLVTLRYENDGDSLLARVKVPIGGGTARFVRIGQSRTFVDLAEVMVNNLDLLFPGMEVEACSMFRVTRNAITERDEEEAEDLLEMIEIEMRERKFAPVVRLQVDKMMLPMLRGRIASELGLDEHADVFEAEGMLGQRDLMEIATLDIPEMRDAPHAPVPPVDFLTDGNIFHAIRETKNMLVHHPYESFQLSVERFVREAADDPKVRAIKMTLYRTSKDSEVIKQLVRAARNGKQVAVVLELKARFDEEANIKWATRMERAGIHVTYGVVGLKTHTKIVLVVRQDFDGLRRYAHAATGNYHAGTARLYTDLGLFTCDDGIGRDLTELFNYLTTGYKPRRKYTKVLVAPKMLKQALLEKIEREIAIQGGGGRGHIQWKLNALEDVDIVRALYRASQRGVTIDLIVRDTCRLRPGVEGVSSTIKVVSVLGRFLEHGRIYYFHNGGRPEFYIGSADAMQRNLEKRVEVLVPVEDPRLQAEIRHVLDIQLSDQRGAWDMQPDGSYIQRNGMGAKHSQQQMIERTERRLKEATRLRRRKVQSTTARKKR
ncbi:MAG: polyphosphate kinase 1 [Deltaproteobacteria bacterium]|nr:polyphosphate kinase 1 [Deltaproteobacteria bacterium]MDQ3295468.1 polyphosphate kinase 1 [Myxococcota bacterium]